MYLTAFIVTTIGAGLAHDAGHNGLALSLLALSVVNVLYNYLTPPELR